MKIVPFGDSALLVNFEQIIDLKVNHKVNALYSLITRANLEEITFMIPAYCSLTIGFDFKKINHQSLEAKLRELTNQVDKQEENEQRELFIPVCYDDEYGLDLSEMVELSGLTKRQIVEYHVSSVYNVYMIGFIPGFPYMGVLPAELNFKRKFEPRLKVPKGSVGITGSQTGIYPMDVPGGWQIIGKTPLNIFDGSKKEPFIFQSGDKVKFEEIDKETFCNIEEEIKTGSFNEMSIYA
jgi:inhibitor of KinA